MVSMPRGPVLSGILDILIHGPHEPEAHPWFDYVSPPKGYDVALEREPDPEGELSDFEIGVLKSVFQEYGHLDQWQLSELTHDLPEWHDPQGSSLPIDPADILRNIPLPPEEIEAKVAEAEHSWFVGKRLRAS